MACAFKMRFWETFSTPGYYDILTEGQYKRPNSNAGCMRLRAPTACPEWNEGTDEDVTILKWLSIHAGLTSECVSEVIELFTRQQAENTTTGVTWNEAAKCVAKRQIMWPPPCYKFILIFNNGDCQNIFYSSCCLYAALDYIIDVRESLSRGNLGAC